MEHLNALYPFFVQDKHLISLTERFERLFRDFEFRGLTIKGPCTNAEKQVFARCNVDTSTPNQLVWIPAQGEDSTIYFYTVDFTNPLLFRNIIKTYETIVIGNSGNQLIPLGDFIIPVFPTIEEGKLFPLNSLQLYGCVFTQDMLKSISSFPVHTLVLTGYVFVEDSSSAETQDAASPPPPSAEIKPETDNVFMIHQRTRVLMISLLSRKPIVINLFNVSELDYWALGSAITYKANSASTAAAPPPHDQLMLSGLCDLYHVVEGYRTSIRTLALLLSTTDLVYKSMTNLFRAVGRISKVILSYSSCGVECPLRTMQHSIPLSYMPVKKPATLNAPISSNEEDAKRNLLLTLFELCSQKGIRNFALDAEMSKHLDNRPFSTFSPYIDTMECEFIRESNTETKHIPILYDSVPDFEVFSWTEKVFKGKEGQRLIPITGKAIRPIIIDPRLEWLGASYIVVNRLNDVSMPKDHVTLLDSKIQRGMLRKSAPPKAADSSKWFGFW